MKQASLTVISYGVEFIFQNLVVKGFDVEQADGLIDDRFGSRQEFARRQLPLARRIKHHAVRHSATNLVRTQHLTRRATMVLCCSDQREFTQLGSVCARFRT